ncbi:type VI secretion system tip protein VgrG [Escherichia coli]|nr:type VI secretion system tip protein VgrG [Escherichia coli]
MSTGLRFTLEVDGLPPDAFAVVSFHLTQSLSSLFSLDLSLVSQQFLSLEFTQVLDKMAYLTVWQGDDVQRRVKGVVTWFELGENDKNQMLYSMKVCPPLWRTGLRQNFRIFQNEDIESILATILKENGVTEWSPLFSEPHPSREFCVQYGETDYDFLCRMAAEEGIFFYEEHAQKSTDQSLVLCDTVRYLPESFEIPWNPNTRTEVSTLCISQFRYSAQIRPSSVVTKDYTFKRPGWAGRFDQEGQYQDYQRTQYEVYDYPGRFKGAHGQNFARWQMDGWRNNAEVARGTSRSPEIWPGRRIALTGHPQANLNREWQVVASDLHGEQPQAVPGRRGSGTTLDNHFAVIPADRTWRPQPLLKPLVDGPQSAVVTGPAGEEIFCDEHGRVRVKFNWDRYNPSNQDSSCWIRVAQAWAGTGFGNLAIPRVGQEVIVDFLNGDPDQPIIMGRTYHQENRTPGSLPGTKTQMTIRSKTYKGSGFNELKFDDATGKEQVYIHAQKNMNTEVLNNRTTDVINNHAETIGNNQMIAVTNNQIQTLGVNQIETVGSNQIINVGSVQVETIGLVRALTVGVAYQTTVGGIMNTSVALMQSSQIGLHKSLRVGLGYDVKVGNNVTFTLAPDLDIRIPYATDPAGNRLPDPELHPDSTLTVWPDNRIAKDAHYVYHYDEYGRLTEKTDRIPAGVIRTDDERTHHYHYDSLHRLVHYIRIQYEEPLVESRYLYDPLGRRTGKRVWRRERDLTGWMSLSRKPEMTWYGWDGDRLTTVQTDTTRIQTVYLPGSFTPLIRIETENGEREKAQRRSLAEKLQSEGSEDGHGVVFPPELVMMLDRLEGEIRADRVSRESRQWLAQCGLTVEQLARQVEPEYTPARKVHLYHCDHRGLPLALISEDGNIAWNAEYDEWGNMLNEENPHHLYQPYRLPGQQYDEESGLYYNRNRYYDPLQGRYITQDPIGLMGGWNPYLYPLNPVTNTDPQGLEAILPGPFPFPIPLPKSPVQQEADANAAKTLTKWWKNFGDAINNPPPPGNCSNDYYEHLKNQKEAICNQKRKCYPTDSCETILQKGVYGLACVSARNNIMNQCFNGGDLRHQLERETVRGTMMSCTTLAVIKGCL